MKTLNFNTRLIALAIAIGFVLTAASSDVFAQRKGGRAQGKSVGKKEIKSRGSAPKQKKTPQLGNKKNQNLKKQVQPQFSQGERRGPGIRQAKPSGINGGKKFVQPPTLDQLGGRGVNRMGSMRAQSNGLSASSKSGNHSRGMTINNSTISGNAKKGLNGKFGQQRSNLTQADSRPSLVGTDGRADTKQNGYTAADDLFKYIRQADSDASPITLNRPGGFDGSDVGIRGGGPVQTGMSRTNGFFEAWPCKVQSDGNENSRTGNSHARTRSDQLQSTAPSPLQATPSGAVDYQYDPLGQNVSDKSMPKLAEHLMGEGSGTLIGPKGVTNSANNKFFDVFFSHDQQSQSKSNGLFTRQSTWPQGSKRIDGKNHSELAGPLGRKPSSWHVPDLDSDSSFDIYDSPIRVRGGTGNDIVTSANTNDK